jgi:hypothetical protein
MVCPFLLVKMIFFFSRPAPRFRKEIEKRLSFGKMPGFKMLHSKIAFRTCSSLLEVKT